MRLEGWLSVLVVSKITEELVHRIGKSLVMGVRVELITQELGLISNAVGVAAVTMTEEEVASVIEVIPLLIGTISRNVALLLKAFADVPVRILEPILQLRISIGIAVDGIDGIPEVVG